MVNQWRKVLQRSKDEKDPLLWHVSDKVENHRDEEANEVTSLGIEFLPFINSFLTAFKALAKARYFKEFFYMKFNFLFFGSVFNTLNGQKLFLEKEINFWIIWIFYFMLEIPLKQSKKTGKVLKSLIYYLKIDQLDLSCSVFIIQSYKRRIGDFAQLVWLMMTLQTTTVQLFAFYDQLCTVVKVLKSLAIVKLEKHEMALSVSIFNWKVRISLFV